MPDPRPHRILRQHVQTDWLLGVQTVPVAQSTPSGRSEPAAGLDHAGRLRLLTDLDEHEVKVCTKCPLCQERLNTVFGEGDPQARLMFIGEGPGENEDQQGRPFVGRAGNMLTRQIVAMGFERAQVYIANVVKCRPPENRTPTPAEVEACASYLRRQIQIIRPRVIVTLGAPATKALLNTTQGISSLRGTWQEYTGLLPEGPVIPVMPTFHPAYLLRQYTQENRARVWSDLQKVRDYLAAC